MDSRPPVKTEILITLNLCRLFQFSIPDLRSRTLLHTMYEVGRRTSWSEQSIRTRFGLRTIKRCQRLLAVIDLPEAEALHRW